MRSILIVGAGQCGLQLGLCLLEAGYEVTIMTARTPDEIRRGAPTSTQAMFGQALDIERSHGLYLWEQTAPAISALHVTVSAPPGTRALEIVTTLAQPGASIDQRVQMAAWLERFATLGGRVIEHGVTTADLDSLAAMDRYELVVVAAGKSDLVSIFEPNWQYCPFTTPQRALAVAYVHGLDSDPATDGRPTVGFSPVPGVGELFVIPCLTLSGPADILFWEAIPGGPADVFQPAGRRGRLPAEQHLATMVELAARYTPWVHQRCARVELTDARATLAGRYTPIVRHPVARLPSGRLAMAAADAVIANDPITGQGSNMAAKCAQMYLDAIIGRGDEPFDETWMQDTFDAFWRRHGEPTTAWTNLMLAQPPPDHVQQLLGAAAADARVARRLAAGFADPADYTDWFLDESAARAYLASLSDPAGAGP